MRVRRASTHARRFTLNSTSIALATAVAASLALPAAAAGPTPQAADGAKPTVAAQTSTGLRVTDLAVTPVSADDAAALTPAALGLKAAPVGTLLAHVRQPAVHDFSMLGVTWAHGAPADVTVEYRIKSDGVWGAWSALETELDAGPLSSKEDSSYRDGTEPAWVGSADGVEVAVYGTGDAPADLEVSTIDPGSDPTDLTALKQSAPKDSTRPGSFPAIPFIVTRSQWGADESLGDACWDPRYGRTFKAAIVHHTAGSNSYRKAESEALVRGIYAYHTQSRGWCDIGYNFLVDRYGTIYEGRDGGIRLSVRGAHSGDYNVNTTGISLMGNFDIAKPTRAMKGALVKLIAWRLGTAYHGAFGKPFIFDHRIARISGHRDVMSTACPGRYVYDWLPRLRKLVATRLGNYQSKIEQVWRDRGGKRSWLGVVKIGEIGGDGGRHTTFQHGRVYYSDHGVKMLQNSPLLRAYVVSGETAGPLGYPVTNAWTVGDGRGQAAEFEGGRIYYHPATGAKVLERGRVLTRYIKLKAALGPLGFPTTGVVDLANGSRARFQHGSITYSSTAHRVTVRYR